ncbi:phospholipase D-like domain-containing protein [Evansella cellulosilytica]|uniref:Phospholipase D/Transphosphatidylase n=1 Tax=Evansella cellulosilytica (strain ATCC 21833 / DSM 2522 / FERM P-1141 / JCM 9156 / N-4) TaxID=649639 RepID=E6TRC1_EVAC2|nr:phospholipase D family protein [Evansella cellulosilytica]ADU30633.1 phospholipase D/Transphosphatidylase [Evansella cellulosilytica DSM 2522]
MKWSEMMKRLIKIITLVALSYLLYAFIFGVVIFSFHEPNSSDKSINTMSQLVGSEVSNDRVALIEGREASFVSRINLIENAQQSIKMTSHSVHHGESTDILFGSLLEAADRGVQVQVLLDGIFHNLRGSARGVHYAFYEHPNIEIKLYEPLSLARPWTWNNRLHDKVLIVDDQKAMIGGRNIGDKYFIDDYEGGNHDRDVVIINNEQRSSNSGVEELNNYFSKIWDHQYSQHTISNLSYFQKSRANGKSEYLAENLLEQKAKQPHLFHQDIDWIETSFPTKNITLIYNPIERMNKDPIVWKQISLLMEEATQSVLVQSPYVIPTDEMLQNLKKENITVDDIVLSTNSLSNSPNVFAISGYLNNRERLVNEGVNIFEYQGPEAIHGKTIVFDQQLSLVGSFNIDARSSFLSTETMVVIDSEELAKEIEQQISDNHLSNSLKVNEQNGYVSSLSIKESDVPFLKRIIVTTLSLFTRSFDFML